MFFHSLQTEWWIWWGWVSEAGGGRVLYLWETLATLWGSCLAPLLWPFKGKTESQESLRPWETSFPLNPESVSSSKKDRAFASRPPVSLLLSCYSSSHDCPDILVLPWNSRSITWCLTRDWHWSFNSMNSIWSRVSEWDVSGLSPCSMTTGKAGVWHAGMGLTKMHLCYNSAWHCSAVVRIHLPVQEMQETQVRSLGREDALAQETVTHSLILAWRIPQTEEPGGLQSMLSELDTTEWLNKMW